ncbi:hypothetical protein ACVWY7_000947 [Bacillus sp. TE9106W]|nr:hypothetical protein TUN_31680 [Bacillus sp. M21]CUB57850.1 hypothetical protein BN2127_JRS10_04288 [Bacillus subtilis]
MLLQPHMYSVFREQDCFRDFYLSVMKIIPFQILDVQNILSILYLYIAFDLTTIPPLKGGGDYRTVVGFHIRKICNSLLCTVQNKNGDQYVKKWFRKHENNEELGRPTFKEVERDWKENRESFVYPNVKALY